MGQFLALNNRFSYVKDGVKIFHCSINPIE
jgi:hypothetical protein